MLFRSLNSHNEPVKILCGHKFCNKCIVKWLEKNSDCPICKSDMRELLQILEKKNENNEIENNEIENNEIENNEIMDLS